MNDKEKRFKKFYEHISSGKGEHTARSRRRKMRRALEKFNPYGKQNNREDEVQPDE